MFGDKGLRCRVQSLQGGLEGFMVFFLEGLGSDALSQDPVYLHMGCGECCRQGRSLQRRFDISEVSAASYTMNSKVKP